MNVNAMEYNSVSCGEDKWYCCMKEMYHFFVLLIIEISIKKNPKKTRDLPHSVVQKLSLKSRHIPYASPYSVVKTCLVKVDTSKQQHINEDFFLKLSRVARARQWMMRGGVK